MTKEEKIPERPAPDVASKTVEQVATPVAPTAVIPPAYVPPQQVAATPAHQETTLAITSMVLGIISVVALGLLTGIPAIITGSIALKKKQGGRGMSIAGIVTGAVGTLFSILFVLFIVFMVFLSANSYNNGGSTDYMTPHNSSDMRSFYGDRT